MVRLHSYLPSSKSRHDLSFAKKRSEPCSIIALAKEMNQVRGRVRIAADNQAAVHRGKAEQRWASAGVVKAAHYIRSLCSRCKHLIHAVLVEDKANGPAVISVLRREIS